jgi:hypothetical protein
MNFNDQTVTWDTEIITMKDRHSNALSSSEVLIEINMSANEPQTLRDEYSRATKFLDVKHKQSSPSLDNVIKTF